MGFGAWWMDVVEGVIRLVSCNSEGGKDLWYLAK